MISQYVARGKLLVLGYRLPPLSFFRIEQECCFYTVILSELLFPAYNMVKQPVERFLVFTFRLAAFPGPFGMLGRFMVHVFVPMVTGSKIHLIFQAEG